MCMRIYFVVLIAFEWFLQCSDPSSLNRPIITLDPH